MPDGAKTVNRIHQHQRRDFSEDEITLIIAGYTKERMTTYQLADKYGCHRDTISTILKKHGVTVTIRRMDAEQIEKSKQLYESGLTLKAIGEQFSISECTVNRALKQAGVEIRKSHRYTSEERREQINNLNSSSVS